MYYDEKECKIMNVIKIQSWWRGHATRRLVKQLAKRMLKRKSIIQQLIQTESNYIKNLAIIISQFKSKLVSNRLINNGDAQIIFGNIDSIRSLNELFYSDIHSNTQNYSHYKTIFKPIIKQVSFFKIYFDYFRNYQKAQQRLNSLRQQSASVGAFLCNSVVDASGNYLKIEDYLIKPVQRLPQYVLLFKILKKSTPQQHPDYESINELLKGFENVNNSNNQKLQQVLNGYRLIQLQRKLGLDHNIIGPSTQIILEQSVTILDDQGIIFEGCLNLLNNYIIISRKIKGIDKLFKAVSLQQGCTIHLNQGQILMFGYNFTVQCLGGQSCTFLCSTKQQLNNLRTSIETQITNRNKQLHQKLMLLHLNNNISDSFLQHVVHLDMLPTVKVLGTQERSDGFFNTTVYIVEVELHRIKCKLFLRYKDIAQLQQIVQLAFPTLTFTQILSKQNWLLNHTDDVIQQRKIQIQKILWQILTKKQVVDKKPNIFTKLGLPKEFYCMKPISLNNLRKSSTNKHFSVRSSNGSTRHQKHIPTKKCSKSVFAELQQQQEEKSSVNESKRNSYHQPVMNLEQLLAANSLCLGYIPIIMDKGNKNNSYIIINIDIPSIIESSNYRTLQLRCDGSIHARQFINQIANSLSLKHFKDCKLIIQRDNFYRYLDDEQIVSNFHQQIVQNNYHLVLKKIITLQDHIQDHQLRQDSIRLMMWASQLVIQFKRGKFSLQYNEIVTLAVLVAIITSPQSINTHPSQLAVTLKNHIFNRYASFQAKTYEWQIDFQKRYVSITTKIQQTVNYNTQNSNPLTQDQLVINTSIQFIACLVLIQLFRKHTVYGSIPFNVQISRQLKKIFQQSKPKLKNRNCWLLIKHNCFQLYSIELRETLSTYSYQQIYSIDVRPSSVIVLLGPSKYQLKLKSAYSYSIRQYLSYYQNYRRLVNQVQNDQDFRDSMIERVKDTFGQQIEEVIL